MADSNSPEANFRLGNVTATVWSNESSSANGEEKGDAAQKGNNELRPFICPAKPAASVLPLNGLSSKDHF